MSQISVMQDGKRARLYCCHSIVTRDAARAVHVLSVGVDLVPALEAQGLDGAGIVASVAEACLRGGGDAPIPPAARSALQSVSQVSEYPLDPGRTGIACGCYLSAQRRLPPHTAPLQRGSQLTFNPISHG